MEKNRKREGNTLSLLYVTIRERAKRVKRSGGRDREKEEGIDEGKG